MTDDEKLQTIADNIKQILQDTPTDELTRRFINELIEESIIADYIMEDAYSSLKPDF